jgi:hypothetical protein
MIFLVQRSQPDGVCTLGELLIDGKHFCYTLEPDPPILAGTFDLTIGYSPHFNRLMPQVGPVPGHYGIMLHWGNWLKDTKLCTLVGETEGNDFVGHSEDAFNELFQIIQQAVAEGPCTISYADPTVPMPPSVPRGDQTG